MKLVDSLKEKLGDVFTDELKEAVTKEINEMINVRVKAKEAELLAQAKEEASKEYVGQIKEYDKAMEEVLREYVGTFVKEQAKSLRTFKETVVNNLSDFFEVKIDEVIPKELKEAQAKVAIYEPIIENIRKSFSENYLRVDSEQFKLLQDARKRIEELREEKSKLMAEAIELKKGISRKDKKEFTEKVCSELTETQAKRFRTITENLTLEQLRKNWEELVDLVTEEPKVTKKVSVKPSPRKGEATLKEGSEVPDSSEPVVSEMDVYAKEYKSRFQERK